MKIIAAGIAAAAACAVLLCGCSPAGPDPRYGSRRDLDMALAEDIVGCMNAGDIEAFKDRLAPKCLQFQSDADELLSPLFGNAGGAAIKKYNGGTEEKNFDSGKMSRLLNFDLEIESAEGTLFALVTWYPVNEFDAEYEGINFIYIGTVSPWEILPENVVIDGWEVNLYKFRSLGIYTDANADESFVPRTQDELPELN